MQDFWNLSAEQQQLIRNRQEPASSRCRTVAPQNVNPCCATHGEGPTYSHCSSCAHLVQVYANATIYKCLLRGVTGKSTDHRKGWPACAKFEERTDGHIPFYRK